MIERVGHAIITTFKRLAQATALRDRLRAEGLRTLLFVDTQHLGNSGNAQQAWEALAGSFMGGIVYEDDVRLCENFAAAADAALTARPAEVIAFFGALPILAEAQAQGYTWAAARTTAWNQCLYMPTRLAAAIVQTAEKCIQPSCRWWDERLSVHCLLTGRSVFYTVPSLVEHLDTGKLFGQRRLAGSFAEVCRADFGNLRTFDAGGNSLAAYHKVLRSDFLATLGSRPASTITIE